jgi:predicted phage tail protein
MESLVEVKLIGELGRRFGRSYSFVASSPREVISALSNQIEGFKDYLCGAHERGIGFRLVDGDAEGMGYEEAMMGCKQLIIAPVITGGGTFGKILLGVALVALAFVPLERAVHLLALLRVLPLAAVFCSVLAQA